MVALANPGPITPLEILQPLTPAEQLTLETSPRDGNEKADVDSKLIGFLLDTLKTQLPELSEELLETTREEIDKLESLTDRVEFLQAIDEVREQNYVATDLAKIMVNTGTAATAGLSIGYVAWLARGGLLLSSFLSSMPAWRLIDPIPVLAYLDEEGEGEEGESLASLISDAAAKESPPEKPTPPSETLPLTDNPVN